MDAQEDLDVSGHSAAFGLWCRASDSHGYANATSEARPPSRPGREINEWEEDGDGRPGHAGLHFRGFCDRLSSEFANVRFGDTRGG